MKSLVALIIIISVLGIFSAIQLKSKVKICSEEICFEVEVADTPEIRAKGLMFRESLSQDKGMFFIFENSEVYPFWMKNTLIPLDIIWLDENFKVVHIETAIPCKKDPCPNYNPKTNAKYVLEINAGKAEESNIEINSKLSYQQN